MWLYLEYKFYDITILNIVWQLREYVSCLMLVMDGRWKRWSSVGAEQCVSVLLPPEQQSTKSKCGNICSYKIEKYTALSKLQDVSNAIKYTILPEYSNVCSWYNHCMPLSASYIYTCMLHVLLCTFDTFAARHTNDRVYNVHASNQCWQTAFRGWFYFFFSYTKHNLRCIWLCWLHKPFLHSLLWPQIRSVRIICSIWYEIVAKENEKKKSIPCLEIIKLLCPSKTVSSLVMNFSISSCGKYITFYRVKRKSYTPGMEELNE